VGRCHGDRFSLKSQALLLCFLAFILVLLKLLDMIICVWLINVTIDISITRPNNICLYELWSWMFELGQLR